MTQKDKIPVQSRVQRGEKAYAPFMPIIAYLQEQGAGFGEGKSQVRPFNPTPNGSQCFMTGGYDIRDLRDVFDFPDHFVFDVPYPNCVWDKRHNVTLCIGT